MFANTTGIITGKNADNLWSAYNDTMGNNAQENIIAEDTMASGIPAAEIYDSSWVNHRVHVYKDLDVPSSYDINVSNFAMPIKKDRIIVTSNFGYRPRFRRMHKGIDLKLATGDTVYAAFTGKVRVAEYEANGYGNFVVMRHHNGLETVYGHMSKILVKTDQFVKKGEAIGLGGNTGRSFGSHLHFETRFCGVAIDPSKIFNFERQNVTSNKFAFKN